MKKSFNSQTHFCFTKMSSKCTVSELLTFQISISNETPWSTPHCCTFFCQTFIHFSHFFFFFQVWVSRNLAVWHKCWATEGKHHLIRQNKENQPSICCNNQIWSKKVKPLVCIFFSSCLFTPTYEFCVNSFTPDRSWNWRAGDNSRSLPLTTRR